MHSKQALKDLFSKNTVNITFKKKDNTERKMYCTLKPELLPVHEKKNATKAENEDVLPVWDLDEKAFRSFRIDSLISYQLD